MLTIRTLRRERGLTLIDLARLSGIPARTLSAIEHGLERLEPQRAVQLAAVFEVPPETLRLSYTRPSAVGPVYPGWVGPAFALLVVALLTMVLMVGQASASAPATAASDEPSIPLVASPEPTGTPGLEATEITAALSELFPGAAFAPDLGPSPVATGESAPEQAAVVPVQDVPTPMPVSPDPLGCPLLAEPSHIVVTQGYGVGTHAPASVWGGIDLGIDSNGDGSAEPDASRGTIVLATNGGIAHVWMGSWPGGNFVKIEDPATGWSTAYGHLDTVIIQEGQTITTGTPIGTVGSTGFSSGPHLHYEIWRYGENRDPMAVTRCWS